MLAKTFSATVLGINAHPIEVEVDISMGLSSFNIVGLPDGTIKESRERIMAAIHNSGISFPIRRVVVNLAPANLRKIGSGFDLPIAVALLGALGLFSEESLERYLIVGELTLDGQVRHVRGMLPIALAARECGVKGLILPKVNEAEAAVVSDVWRLPVESLRDVVEYFQGQRAIHPNAYDLSGLFQQHESYEEDFQDVKGQEMVKRALEVSASGNHNLLMIGPPGTGKTMLARRIPTILPPPSFEEALEITKIHSIAGVLHADTPLVATRPFQSPHHSISPASLVGGGMIPGPGEISLAHHGVLFLDELPEFPRGILELLRQPLEDRRITISRATLSLEFPTNFLLLAAMNPCPCGYAGMSPKSGGSVPECRCTFWQIEKYRSKISGPLLDRMDIQLPVSTVEYENLANHRRGESSASIRKRVIQARQIQAERFRDSKTRHNAEMSRREIEHHAAPTPAAQRLLEKAMTNIGLSARAYDRILKVSRTIADLAGVEIIDEPHIGEAIQYRSLDRPIS